MIRGWLIALCLVFAVPQAQAGDRDWVSSWATAVMPMEGDNALPPGEAGPLTIRQTMRLSVGGTRIRLRVSNRHGRQPLRVDGVRVALASAAGAASGTPGTERVATFAGERSFTVPAGADYWSDPVALAVKPLAHVAVAIDLAERPELATGHPGARTTTHIGKADAAVKVVRWYHLSGIDVDSPGASAIALLGDSITDGYGVVPDSDGRWTDYLAQRLAADPATRDLAIANFGIGGNRLLLDGLGPNAMARLDRDVLLLPGVEQLVVMIGVNDLGTLTREQPVSEAEHRQLVARMIAGYRQIATRARAAGVRVIGATIMPYGGSEYYHPDRLNEADRQALNAFIRTPGNFDAVIDMDAAMRDPAKPTHLRKALDSGDGLHPSNAGYRAMAAAVPLAVFEDAAR
ncbi:SGNH/GDSL hydrolase family protein [Sphingomonas sp. S1-29]|uniref:SGNH/GDSL hydrolase family protein n=1 Tax=Sphingomonas sp. S1-29 TaxID=2991074 RepID=UPI002240AA7A|nr:SGNH/GDSL hydrolase family protein [Sphingomonas sp. S1-29]UZK70663.1 SGNH/GDSL hydrolase family protein [Sphingomonas sp. S1-29]